MQYFDSAILIFCYLAPNLLYHLNFLINYLIFFLLNFDKLINAQGAPGDSKIILIEKEETTRNTNEIVEKES